MDRTTKTIGVCVSQLHESETAGLVQTISRRARESGYWVLIYGCFAKMDFPTVHSNGEASIFRDIPMKKLTALVLLGQTILHRELLEELRDQALAVDTPVITVDYEMERCFNISLDYLSSFKRLVRHVIEGHHRLNPFFMAGYRGNAFSEERLEAYKEVLLENGMRVDPDHIAYGDFWERPARMACEQWMERTEDLPDAIICANDMMALTVITVLKEHDLEVPGDVIVTGFDGIGIIDYCSPRLTTAKVDREGIVVQIMKLVEQVVEEPELAVRNVSVPSHIQKGESCGCTPVQPHTSNQYVLELYGQIAGERIHINETFQIMTRMTEGHSMMNILGDFRELVSQITRGDFQLFVNRKFCQHTDIPLSKKCKTENALLLIEQVGGKYAVPLREVPDRSVGELPEELERGSGQMLYLPLNWQDEVYGYMALQYYDQELNYERLNEFIMTLAQILGTVRKQSQLHEMYIRDALTGLYNRRGFYVELERQMQKLKGKESRIFLASVDLDRLKSINDGYGHGEGDVAITAVADALEEAVGEQGFCARFGGDEYVAVHLWQADQVPENYTEDFQKRFQNLLDQWNQKYRKGYTLGASTGIILTEITDAGEIDALMKRADDNMYHCKDRHHSIRGSRRS